MFKNLCFPRCYEHILLFSFWCCIVSPFAVRSAVHLAFILVYSMRVWGRAQDLFGFRMYMQLTQFIEKVILLPVLCFVIKREHACEGLYLDILFYYIGLFVSVVSFRFSFLFICCCYIKIHFSVCVYLYTSSANLLNSLILTVSL